MLHERSRILDRGWRRASLPTIQGRHSGATRSWGTYEELLGDSAVTNSDRVAMLQDPRDFAEIL